MLPHFGKFRGIHFELLVVCLVIVVITQFLDEARVHVGCHFCRLLQQSNGVMGGGFALGVHKVCCCCYVGGMHHLATNDSAIHL